MKTSLLALSTMELIQFFLLQTIILLGVFPFEACASPFPMDPGGSGSGYGHGHNYNYYGHPEEAPGSQDVDANEGSFWPPPLNRLNVPDQQFYFDDSLGTSRLMTPRTRDLVETTGSRRRSRLGHGSGSHDPQAAPDTSRRRNQRGSTSQWSVSSVTPILESSNEQHEGGSSSNVMGVGSSSHPNLDYVAPLSQYSNFPDQSYEGIPPYPSQTNYEQDMTTAFTHMNMQEIPVQGDTSRSHGSGSRRRPRNTSSEQQHDHEAQEQMSKRRRERDEWELSRPSLAIPLRLLTADECLDIRVGRHTPRYRISLYLEDQFFRNAGIINEPPVPEPNWKEHYELKRLLDKPLREHANEKLRLTQKFLDELLEKAGLFKWADRSRTGRSDKHPVTEETAPTEGSSSDAFQLRQTKYQNWTDGHGGILVPLRMMHHDDLASMGLTRGSFGYKLGSYIEQETLKLFDCDILKDRPEVQAPQDDYKYDHFLTEQYPLPEGSFLRRKQEQVQGWFQKYEYMPTVLPRRRRH